MKNSKVLFLTQASMIAAVYVALTLLLQPFSFGQIQVRVSEMLTVLPFFTPAAVPGLFAGCLLANTLGGAMLPDILFGSLATLAGAWGTYRIRKYGLKLAPIPPIAANTIVVPFILKAAYGVPLPLPVLFLTIGAGEALSCGVLGIVLGKALEKHSRAIFGQYAL